MDLDELRDEVRDEVLNDLHFELETKMASLNELEREFISGLEHNMTFDSCIEMKTSEDYKDNIKNLFDKIREIFSSYDTY